MKRGILLITLFLSHFHYAQQRCGTVTPTSGEFENWISTRIQANKLRLQAEPLQSTVYQVPVVVHVLHKGEEIGTGVNLSDERIIAQIDSLNADFRRTNADAVNTPAVFEPVAADTEIEFVLARQDPSGNPTNGIIRKKGAKISYSHQSDKLQLRSESYWPAEHYLNIYLIDIRSLIGFSSFPVTDIGGINNTSGDFLLDAILVDYQYFGNNPDATSFESRGRTLTHEVGHYLGLRHIWGEGNCTKDDFVEDTPLTIDDHGGAGSPCTFPLPDDSSTAYDDGNSCTNETPDLPDMYQNYMDYTDDICMNLFTEGQKVRMRTVLENSPRRVSLITSPGLNEPPRFVTDLAIKKIINPDFAECANQFNPSLELVNYGTDLITSYEVQVYVNGSPSGAAINQPTSLLPFSSEIIALPNQLITTVPSNIAFEILSVNGVSDENTANNIQSKVISYTSSLGLAFLENFEGANMLAGRVGDPYLWDVSDAPKEIITNKALVFKGFNNTTSIAPEIISTPPLDLTGFQDVELSFNYAYAYPQNAIYDELKVLISYDCGEAYEEAPLFSASGPGLATTGETSNTSFIPANINDWQPVSFLIPRDDATNTYSDQMKIAFVVLNGGANNIYIDDVLVEVSNRADLDASLIDLEAPIVTCASSTNISLLVKNAGKSIITSLTLGLTVNGSASNIDIENLSIDVDETRFVQLEVPSPAQQNDVSIEVLAVNNSADESAFNNYLETSIILNSTEDEYPLLVDFETNDQWINASTGTTSIWERIDLSGNGMLVARGFEEELLGGESWFISPALTRGGLDSAGLYFRTSYASREGLTDRLQVLASTDCGNNYDITLLDADSEALAVGQVTNQWVPINASDWKEFRLDLSQINPGNNKIRIAFVFTNGNGNDLYIDDISIRGNEPPTYKELFRVYPNPFETDDQQLFLGFNLDQKEPVTVEIIDMSGRNISRQTVFNAFNQILPVEVPSLKGLYFVRVIGPNFAQTQKLFINR